MIGAMLICIFLSTHPADAVTLNVNPTTLQLEGASNVNVGGILYDVEFLAGACITIFPDCNATTELTFQTGKAALQAAVALNDQVFVDSPAGQFDSNPELTRGCTFHHNCSISIPYHIDEPSPGDPLRPIFVEFFEVFNFSVPEDRPDIVDFVFRSRFAASTVNLSGESIYARFRTAVNGPAPVPEPGTILLLSSGLLALTGYRWRQKRRLAYSPVK